MTEEHIWIYILVVPIICLVLGYAVGYKYGWQLRDNKAKKDKLKKLLDEVQGKVDDISSMTNVWTPPGEYTAFDFNIIGLRKKEEPLSLEQQLEKALEEEDYEKAAQIRNLINNENEKEK